MLAKHYYQAASAWVVFFAPASDADIGYYNEFMHYLEEKQRAAVAKLDDKTTLFLVPPSDFAEKVLRVPGKLCISGVVLRLELPGSNFGSLNYSNEKRELLSFHGDAQYTKPSTPSGHFRPMGSFPDLARSGGDPSFLRDVSTSGPPAAFSGSAHAAGRMSDSYNESRHDYQLQQRNPMPGPNWSPHHRQNSFPGNRNTPSQASNAAIDTAQEHHSVIPRAVQEDDMALHAAGMSSNPLSGTGKPSLMENKSSVPLSLPTAALQPQQLAQLASSLLGQRQPGSNANVSVGEDIRHGNTMNQLENQFRTAQTHGLQNNRVASEIPTSQFGQQQQLQQQQQHHLQASNVPKAVPASLQRDVQPGTSANPQIPSTSTQEAEDGDPQKRLQATLQLAAALLQQIQQGKGT